MTKAREELQARRLDAVRAWTSFVELGDEATPLVRPEILRSWELVRRGGHPRRRRGAARRRGRHHGVLARLAAADGRRAGRERAAAYGRGRRPGHRRHRRRDPDPLDVRRPGDAAQGRDRELRAGGRWDEASVGTNALAIANRTGEPSMVFSAEHYASMVHNWVCWAAPAARPGHRRADRRHRPLHDVGPHPPDRAGHGPGDGPADRDGDAELAAMAGRRART